MATIYFRSVGMNLNFLPGAPVEKSSGQRGQSVALQSEDLQGEIRVLNGWQTSQRVVSGLETKCMYHPTA